MLKLKWKFFVLCFFHICWSMIKKNNKMNSAYILEMHEEKGISSLFGCGREILLDITPDLNNGGDSK